MCPKKEPVSSSQIAFALGLVYVVWGSTYLAIRVAVASLPPFLLAALRFLTAGGLMFAVMRARGAAMPTARQWRASTVVGGFLLLGGNGLVVWAERTVPSGLTALLVSMVPLWMALADWARPGGSRPGGRVAAGLLIGFAGLAVLVAPDLRAADLRASAGLVALLIASPAWAIGSVYAKRAPLPPSPFMATACEMIGGGAALLVVSLAAGEPFRPGWAHAATSSWAALGYLVVFGSMVGFTAYVWVLTHAPLAVASTYAYVNPVVAVVLGWAMAGEPLTGRTVAGGAIIVAAVALITSAPRRAPVPAEG